MTFVDHPLAGPAVRLVSDKDEALVALLGAHVVSWHHGDREMLWTAHTLLPSKPLRGGIPVCWPWFAAHPSDPTKPAHGVARFAQWDIIEQAADRVSLRLKHEELDARVDVAISENLAVSLTTHNSGQATVTVSAALHTYLAVDDIGRTTVTGLNGAHYIDKLDNNLRKPQDGVVTFDREVDRIYTAASAVMSDGSHSIEVNGAGTSNSLVVWNPWIDKSARLGDMDPQDYRRMVCLETAWAGDDARQLHPGAASTLTTILIPRATTS